MNPKTETRTAKESTDLIVYQLGEVKALLTTMMVRFDNYRDNTDRRISELEKFQATQMIQEQILPKVDVQKIILTAFALVSTVVAAALGIQNYGK